MNEEGVKFTGKEVPFLNLNSKNVKNLKILGDM